jgi:hypothetical protein
MYGTVSFTAQKRWYLSITDWQIQALVASLHLTEKWQMLQGMLHVVHEMTAHSKRRAG